MSVELYVDKVGYLFCFLFFQHFKAVFHYLLFCMVSRENFFTFFGLPYAMCLFFLQGGASFKIFSFSLFSTILYYLCFFFLDFFCTYWLCSAKV